jgi:hypothetical protein
MTSNEKQQDTERGFFGTIEADQTTATLSEKFLLFRDFSFGQCLFSLFLRRLFAYWAISSIYIVCFILLHLGSAIVAIPTIVNRVYPFASYGCLAVAITTGILVPLFGLVGYVNFTDINANH